MVGQIWGCDDEGGGGMEEDEGHTGAEICSIAILKASNCWRNSRISDDSEAIIFLFWGVGGRNHLKQGGQLWDKFVELRLAADQLDLLEEILDYLNQMDSKPPQEDGDVEGQILLHGQISIIVSFTSKQFDGCK